MEGTLTRGDYRDCNKTYNLANKFVPHLQATTLSVYSKNALISPALHKTGYIKNYGPTSRINWYCSKGTGGAKRGRTADLLRAKQALSQLSYSPTGVYTIRSQAVVGLGGLEPPTSPLSGVRSNHLSYRPSW